MSVNVISAGLAALFRRISPGMRPEHIARDLRICTATVEPDLRDGLDIIADQLNELAEYRRKDSDRRGRRQ